MSPALIGMGAGALIGLAMFFTMSMLAERIAREQPKSEAPRVLKIVAWVDLLLFPLLGWFIGPLLA